MAAQGTATSAASSLEFERATGDGSPEECSSGGLGESANTTIQKGDDPVAPQETAKTATSSVEIEDTNGALQEGSFDSSGEAVDAKVVKDDAADGSYVLVDRATLDGTTEGDLHAIEEDADHQAVCEGIDNCAQNFVTVAEDLGVTSASSSNAEDDEEASFRKELETDFMLQIIDAAEAEQRSCLEPTKDGLINTDSISVEQRGNDLISSSNVEVDGLSDDDKRSCNGSCSAPDEQPVVSESPVEVDDQAPGSQLELSRGSCENDLHDIQGDLNVELQGNGRSYENEFYDHQEDLKVDTSAHISVEEGDNTKQIPEDEKAPNNDVASFICGAFTIPENSAEVLSYNNSEEEAEAQQSGFELHDAQGDLTVELLGDGGSCENESYDHQEDLKVDTSAHISIERGDNTKPVPEAEQAPVHDNNEVASYISGTCTIPDNSEQVLSYDKCEEEAGAQQPNSGVSNFDPPSDLAVGSDECRAGKEDSIVYHDEVDTEKEDPPKINGFVIELKTGSGFEVVATPDPSAIMRGTSKGNLEFDSGDNFSNSEESKIGNETKLDNDGADSNNTELKTRERIIVCSEGEQHEDGHEKDAKPDDGQHDLKEAKIDDVASSIGEHDNLVTSGKLYMIRVPRVLDSKLSEQVNLAHQQLEERTQRRNSIGKELQAKKAICNENAKAFNDAKAEEKIARQAFFAKRKEVDECKSSMADFGIRGLIDSVAAEMQHLEHTIQHETISLKEEKLLLRKIKELKQNHSSLSTKLGANAELHKTLEVKNQIEAQIKHLSSELENLRSKLLEAKTRTDICKKKCDEEYKILRELQAQHRDADDLRQQAYMNLRNLKKELSTKNRHFYKYKDDVNATASYISAGNLKALENHCIQQVETIMELWNKNDEFRKSYIQFSQFSVIRRFKTLDGRSLGPDEEPATLPIVERKPSTNPSVLVKVKTHDVVTHENASNTLVPTELNCSPLNVEPQKNHDKSNEQSISKQEKTSALVVVDKNKHTVAKVDEETVFAMTSDEVIREELMKQEAAEELKAQEEELKANLIAEQKAKRKEAEERKRRKAEKAKASAVTKALREAELREKKRAKKRTGYTKPCGDNTTDATTDVETLPTDIMEVVGAPENKLQIPEKPSRTSAASKLKIKPLPPPLRHKRKSQTLTWALLAVVVTVIVFAILFWAGNRLSSYGI